MPDINVILPDGSEKTYYNVETVTFDSANDPEGTETFVTEHLIQGQVQADWDQEDDTHPGYIWNKPDIADMIDGLSKVATSGNYADLKGKIVGDARVISEDVFEFVLEDGICSYIFDEPLDVVKGESYKIMWDGTEYICECKDVADIEGFESQSILYLGNLYIIAPVDNVPDTVEPFCVIVEANGIVANDNEITHKVGITPVNSIITLDAKYLPDNLATQEWVREEIGKIDISEFDEIPAYTPEDEGKVLSVKNNELSWETVSGGSGESDDESGATPDFVETTTTTTVLVHRNQASFEFDENFQVYRHIIGITLEQNRKWEEHDGDVNVYWDGNEFTVSMQTVTYGGTYLKAVGNLVPFEGNGNNEPFIITVLEDRDNVFIMCVYALDGVNTHDVQVSIQIDETKVKDDYLPASPLYDLTDMGMIPITTGNLTSSVYNDDTNILSVICKGITRFAFSFMGNVVVVPALFTYIPTMACYTYSTVLYITENPYIITIKVGMGSSITVTATLMSI